MIYDDNIIYNIIIIIIIILQHTTTARVDSRLDATIIDNIDSFCSLRDETGIQHWATPTGT